MPRYDRPGIIPISLLTPPTPSVSESSRPSCDVHIEIITRNEVLLYRTPIPILISKSPLDTTTSRPLQKYTMATIVLGAQWGDEGKGKLVDILCPTVKLCARAQGGNNAGHTIVANGVTYDFHLLPSGLINPDCTNVIGSGVVVHVPSFFKELKDLETKGLGTARERIFLSDRAQVVFDLHQLVDGLEEVELGGKSIGTTRKGIGPAYSTKATRSGVRIAEIFNEVTFEEKLRELARGFKKRYGDLLQYDVEEEISRFKVGFPIYCVACELSLTFMRRNTAKSLPLSSSMPFPSSSPPSRPHCPFSSKAPMPSCLILTTAPTPT